MDIEQPVGASLDRDLVGHGEQIERDLDVFIERRDTARRKEEGERLEEAWRETTRREDERRRRELDAQWYHSTTRLLRSVTGPFSKASWHITRRRPQHYKGHRREMPRECTVCNHPDVFTINERLVGIGGKQSLRNIAKQFDVNYQAVNRHKQHIPELLLKASQAMEIAEADGLIDQVRDLQQRTLAILDKAEDDTDLRTALSAISQARSNLELLGKLAGELQQEGSTNLYLNAEWIELKMAIVEALKPHPQALRDVSVALQGAKSNGSN